MYLEALAIVGICIDHLYQSDIDRRSSNTLAMIDHATANSANGTAINHADKDPVTRITDPTAPVYFVPEGDASNVKISNMLAIASDAATVTVSSTARKVTICESPRRIVIEFGANWNVLLSMRGITKPDVNRRVMVDLYECTRRRKPLLSVSGEDENRVFMLVNRMDEEYDFYNPIKYVAHIETVYEEQCKLLLLALKGSPPAVDYGTGPNGPYFEMRIVTDLLQFIGNE